MPTPDDNNARATHLNTPRLPWKRGLTTSSTDPSFAVSKVPTITKPVTVDDATTPTSNTLVIPCKHNFTQIAFFGSNAANETFSAKVWLWTEVNGSVPLWMPSFAVEVAVILSTLPGVDTSPIVATTDLNFFADSVIPTGNYDTVAVPQIFSAVDKADNTSLGYVLVDTMGAALLEVEFDIVAAANANCIYRQF